MPRIENGAGGVKSTRFHRETVIHSGTTANQLPLYDPREIAQALSAYPPIAGGSEDTKPEVHPNIEAAWRRRAARLQRDLR